jgi:hypothetical protein
MILDDFILPSRQNKTWTESGIDSINRCREKRHFKEFPYEVVYNYNSRGFRDLEWPESIDELKQAIWCFGDSFTVGIGSPLTHTWVNILQSKLNRRCINISMDGASNQWIARKIKRVLEVVDPSMLCVQWSHLHRTESEDSSLIDEERRQHYTITTMKDEFKQQREFLFLIKEITSLTDKPIFNSIIPNTSFISFSELVTKYTTIWNTFKGADWPTTSQIEEYQKLPNWIKQECIELENIANTFDNIYKDNTDLVDISNQLLKVNQIDYARDYCHYDKLTSDQFVSLLISNIDRY